jgi:Xaa-Pro aminopeptidase
MPEIAAVPTYSRAERERRWALARDVMRAEDVDGLLIYGGPESASFAPDAYFSNDAPGSIVLFFGGEDPVQLVSSPARIGEHIEASSRGDELWIEPANIHVGMESRDLGRLLIDRGLRRGTLGVIGLDRLPQWPTFPYVAYAPLADQFPDLALKPVGVELMRRMLPNSTEELALVEQAARVCDVIAEAMLNTAKPGACESDLLAAALAQAHQYETGARILLSSGPGFLSRGPAPWAYRPQPSRVLQDGDVIMAEVRCAVGMKESESQVAIALGDIHPHIERAAEVARHSYDTALSVLRPGYTFGEVARAMEETARGAAGWHAHPVAHSINPPGLIGRCGAGFRSFGPAQKYGSLAETSAVMSELLLQPGMTIAIEPSCVIGGRMAMIGGTVVVTDDKPDELNSFTTQLLRA